MVGGADSDPGAGWSVAFASELRALLASGLLGTPRLDPHAVAPRKRQSLVRRNQTTDNLTKTLGSFKMLQDSQIKAVQQKLAQAGIRKKEYAVTIIAARLVKGGSSG